MKVFVPKERQSNEYRVAATPETVEKMAKLGLEIWVEPGAGEAAGFIDDAYRNAGAQLKDGTDAWQQADILLKVAPVTAEESARSKDGSIAIGFFEPHKNLEIVRDLVNKQISSLAMELVPRITRAQTMDALSSQASIGGYKAVILAASRLGRYFPLMMTAAGTVSPSKVVILGAGVAGLQALATAKRLGAVVEVSDIRPVVKEQVESLGGRFIDLPEQVDAEDAGGYAKEMGEDFLRKQREILTERLRSAEVVITTAQIPGKKAPMLLSREMASVLRPGAVVVDMAASTGGNCELTRMDEEVVHNGVLFLGPSNLPATMAHDASTLYARNILALIEHVVEEGEVKLDPEDDVLAGTLLTHQGEVLHQPTAARLQEGNG